MKSESKPGLIERGEYVLARAETIATPIVLAIWGPVAAGFMALAAVIDYKGGDFLRDRRLKKQTA